MDEPVARSWHGCSPKTGHQLDVPCLRLHRPLTLSLSAVSGRLWSANSEWVRSFLLSLSSGAIGFAFGHGRARLFRDAEEQPPSAFIDSLATVRMAFGGAGSPAPVCRVGSQRPDSFGSRTPRGNSPRRWPNTPPTPKRIRWSSRVGPAPAPCALDSRDHVEVERRRPCDQRG